MASTSDFRNGLVLDHKSGLWKIIEFLHVKPGKGPAFVRTKLKNCRTGQVVEETFRSGEKINTVKLESRDYNYLYSDMDSYIFMDSETFDQVSLSKENVADVIDFLIENTSTSICFHENEPIEVKIPQHMDLEVVQTDPGEKGNTAQGGTKPAKLESGVTIQVPLFIQEGEKVRVDTRTRKYMERSK